MASAKKLFNGIFWLLVLVFISFWLAAICFPIYVIVSVVAACIPALKDFSELLLKGVTFPATCSKNMVNMARYDAVWLINDYNKPLLAFSSHLWPFCTFLLFFLTRFQSRLLLECLQIFYTGQTGSGHCEWFVGYFSFLELIAYMMTWLDRFPQSFPPDLLSEVAGPRSGQRIAHETTDDGASLRLPSRLVKLQEEAVPQFHVLNQWDHWIWRFKQDVPPETA